ncbi:MAG: hypothetical protein M3Q23_13445 [Actinomycetota bacterium]|nr:hypothetical protein [Actinomycetota bacterium]
MGDGQGAARLDDVWRRRLAWAGFIAIVLVYAIGLAISILSGGSTDPFGLLVFVFPLVGILILTRQSGNTIGWILLAIGGVAAASGVLTSYAEYGLRTHPGSLPGADVALAISGPSWAPIIGIIGTYLLLLFPDGRPPSPGWRWVGWLSAVGIGGTMVGLTIVPGNFADSGYPNVINPLGIEALRGVEWIAFLFIPLIPISIVLSAISLVRRFRRSTGTVRLQLKWLTAAAAVTAVLYAFAFAVPGNWGSTKAPAYVSVIQTMGVLSFFLIPIAIGFAILRYRLYDIDVVINKALVYGSLTAVLAGVYVGLAVGLGSFVGRDNSLVIAGSTLVVAALFRPARRRIQGFIDRRFYRRKYDAQRTLEAFTARLRDQVDLDELHAHLLAVVDETVRPASISLWLREGGA